MVVGVKVLSSKRFKGYCRSCHKALLNGQLVAYVDGTTPLRCHHIDCDWRGSRLQVHLAAGARVLTDSSVPDDRRACITARLARALVQAQNSLQEDLQRQLAWKRQCIQEYPAGTRLIHTSDGRIRFCEVVCYSALGNSVRLREVEKTVVDSWQEEKRYVDRRGETIEVRRRACMLCRAEWGRQTGAALNANTCHFGDRLVRGRDFDGCAVEYDPTAIRPADEVPAEPGALVVNVRSMAGVLWFSAALGPDLTAGDHGLERRVANAIGLLPGRGTVLLTHQGTLLERAQDGLAALCQHESGRIELTAVVQDDPSWPLATDGRPMPYARAHRICGESLAFDVSTSWGL